MSFYDSNQPWSESGLDLLRIIKNIITKNGGREKMIKAVEAENSEFLDSEPYYLNKHWYSSRGLKHPNKVIADKYYDPRSNLLTSKPVVVKAEGLPDQHFISIFQCAQHMRVARSTVQSAINKGYKIHKRFTVKYINNEAKKDNSPGQEGNEDKTGSREA